MAPEPGDAALRNERLVAELEAAGALRSPAVAAAFRAGPRHHFLPGRPLDEVYDDAAVMTKVGERGAPVSSSSPPPTMAIRRPQLRPQAGHPAPARRAGTRLAGPALRGRPAGAAPGAGGPGPPVGRVRPARPGVRERRGHVLRLHAPAGRDGAARRGAGRPARRLAGRGGTARRPVDPGGRRAGRLRGVARADRGRPPPPPDRRPGAAGPPAS